MDSPSKSSNSSLLVLCGPSGSGKSTLMKKLMEKCDGKFGFSVSHTTRKPREGEVNGRDYHFVTPREMEHLRKSGEFVEDAYFSGNFYGTSKKSIEEVIGQGKICILDIEVQGVKTVKEKGSFSPLYVFIMAPSLETLEKRLRERGTEKEVAIQKRLDAARDEISYGTTEGNFDLVIVNNDLDTAYKELRDFVGPLIKKRK